jgi:hydroxymethylpyrimidine pyrophosphatase-like HAD family hydrolase
VYPELEPSDDAWQRISDFTFDIGEHQRVSGEVVARVRKTAHELGATSIASSVHLHVSLDRADKASGTVRLLSELYGLDPFRVLSAYAFIGDSENDAACFGAFRLTLGVRNLSGRPTLGPRFRARGERSRGFVEAADLLLARRAELR